jgi:hypothetical protein
VPEGEAELADVAAERVGRDVLIGDTQHPADLSDRDLDADAGEEADQHRS